MSQAVAEPGEVEEGPDGLLGWIERVGNKVPHPAMIFLGLIALVILLSALLSALDVSVTTKVAEPEGTTVSQTLDDAGSTYPWIESRNPGRHRTTTCTPRRSRSRACCRGTASGTCSPRWCRTSTTSASWP